MRTCCFHTSRAILPSRWGQRVPQCWKERSHFYTRDVVPLHPRNNQARRMRRNLEVGVVYFTMSRNSTARNKKKIHKKYASITMPVLTSISTLLYYRFARYTPPLSHERAAPLYTELLQFPNGGPHCIMNPPYISFWTSTFQHSKCCLP